MFKRFGWLALVLTMAVSAAPSLLNAAGGGGGSVKTYEARVIGYVTAIDYEHGTIKIGASYYGSGSLIITSATKLSLDTLNCSLTDLVVGDWAEARYDYVTKSANKISATSF